MILQDFVISHRFEKTYNGRLVLKEVLTGHTLSLSVSGTGSADEQYSK